jgi:hypothetical protein
MKELKKTEKRKEAKEIKTEKGLGETVRPSSRSSPQPT